MGYSTDDEGNPVDYEDGGQSSGWGPAFVTGIAASIIGLASGYFFSSSGDKNVEEGYNSVRKSDSVYVDRRMQSFESKVNKFYMDDTSSSVNFATLEDLDSLGSDVYHVEDVAKNNDMRLSGLENIHYGFERDLNKRLSQLERDVSNTKVAVGRNSEFVQSINRDIKNVFEYVDERTGLKDSLENVVYLNLASSLDKEIALHNDRYVNRNVLLGDISFGKELKTFTEDGVFSDYGDGRFFGLVDSLGLRDDVEGIVGMIYENRDAVDVASDLNEVAEKIIEAHMKTSYFSSPAKRAIKRRPGTTHWEVAHGKK